MPDTAPARDAFAARASTHAARLAAALLVVLSRGSLPVLLVLIVLATDPPIELPQLLQLLAVLVFLPGGLAWLIRRAAAARAELRSTDLVLRRPDLVVKVPCAALARIPPWAIPLPGPGLTLWMRSGNRLAYAIEIVDPAPLLQALLPVAADAAREALRHPNVAYAHAAAQAPPWRWHHYLWRFVVFALARRLRCSSTERPGVGSACGRAGGRIIHPTMGTKVKVSVTIARDLLREVERLAGHKSRSEVFEHALSAWVRQHARVALDHAIESYYRARGAEEREEDERWAELGDEAIRTGGRD